MISITIAYAYMLAVGAYPLPVAAFVEDYAREAQRAEVMSRMTCGTVPCDVYRWRRQ